MEERNLKLCYHHSSEEEIERQEDDDDRQAVRPRIRKRAPAQLESRFLQQDNMAPETQRNQEQTNVIDIAKGDVDRLFPEPTVKGKQ